MPSYPCTNSLWFWGRKNLPELPPFSPESASALTRQLSPLLQRFNGLEITVLPELISGQEAFPPWFYELVYPLEYVSVHIGGTSPDYLDRPEMREHLKQLAACMDSMGASGIVVHADQIMGNLEARCELLGDVLTDFEIVVENNGFDNEPGSRPESLLSILEVAADFRLCLDIAHVQDFPELALEEFMENPFLAERTTEIHFSFSNIHGDDRYAEVGYPGYAPYHGLYSVVGLTPPSKVLDFCVGRNVIVEGALPPEDESMKYLDQELAMFG